MEKIAPLIDSLRDKHGDGPVCHEPDIAPSTYYRHQQRTRCSERRCGRDRRDVQRVKDTGRVWEESYGVCGCHKIWHQLKREGVSVARCTVSRLMKATGLTGVGRGKKVRTTVSRKEGAAGNRVNRQLWQNGQTRCG